jgi:hypothetical protein
MTASQMKSLEVVVVAESVETAVVTISMLIPMF